MPSNKVRTRFAPSPTGYMHVGNLRTALYTYLMAKHEDGTFILRIEDTDQGRYVEGAVDVIYNTLRETGLLWDEGPDIGGPVGPYVQTQRRDLYGKYAELLIEKKRELLRLRAFYEQLIDATEIYIENENELLDEKSYKLFRLFRDKAVRYKENTDILRESVTHLWDAYQTSIDARQNEIMKLFTVVTSVFLPMTVIVGWYGMNFKYMPELSSRFGYPYVIFLNVAVVFSLIYIFKRKRWI